MEVTVPATATVQDEIVRSATYPVSQERLWKAVTDPNELIHWFHLDKIEMDARDGGEILFTFKGGDTSRAVIRELRPIDRFTWHWKAAGKDDRNRPLLDQESITTIVFLLEPVQEGTRLTITESGFAAITPPEEAQTSYTDHEGGWDGMFANLNGYLGVDGSAS
jgi:uncharacterized protein YndB with AHSA1/START domain